MIVHVIQFMRPNGRQVRHTLEVGDSCKEKYQEIIECGARLTSEQLMSGVVSQTIETFDGDFALVLTNGEDLAENKRVLEVMILDFDKIAFGKWHKQFEN